MAGKMDGRDTCEVQPVILEVLLLLRRMQSDLANLHGRSELQWIKFSNGKAYVCPLQEALNYELLERGERTGQDVSFIYHLVIISIMSP